MFKKLVVIVFLFVVALLPLLFQHLNFFVYNNPIHTKTLLIEGWLPSFALANPPFDYSSYDTIYISGINQKTNWEALEAEKKNAPSISVTSELWLPTKGFIFLSPQGLPSDSQLITTIRIIAKGSQAKGQFAHFYLSARDSILGHTFVKADFDTFTFHVRVAPEKLNDINIYFDNDVLTQTEDINLVVKEIIVNNTSFSSRNGQLIFIKESQDANNFSLFDSNAHETREYLKNIVGVKVPCIVVDTLYYKRNKTLASAQAFGKYLTRNNIHLASLNIYTLDFHSRRTHIAYSKVLPRETRIGTIVKACPDCISEHGTSLLKTYWRTLDEFLSIVFTWL